MFARKNLKERIPFVANGELHEFEYEMRPLSRGEILAMSIEFPTIAGYFFGTNPFPYQMTKQEGKIVRDFSQLEAFLRFMQDTAIVKMSIDDQPYEGNIIDLPDLLVATLIAKFRMFQFLTQADVDFFEKINASLNESSQRLSSSE